MRHGTPEWRVRARLAVSRRRRDVNKNQRFAQTRSRAGSARLRAAGFQSASQACPKDEVRQDGWAAAQALLHKAGRLRESALADGASTPDEAHLPQRISPRVSQPSLWYDKRNLGRD
jgi:hypothetical protein